MRCTHQCIHCLQAQWLLRMCLFQDCMSGMCRSGCQDSILQAPMCQHCRRNALLLHPCMCLRERTRCSHPRSLSRDCSIWNSLPRALLCPSLHFRSHHHRSIQSMCLCCIGRKLQPRLLSAMPWQCILMLCWCSMQKHRPCHALHIVSCIFQGLCNCIHHTMSRRCNGLCCRRQSLLRSRICRIR